MSSMMAAATASLSNGHTHLDFHSDILTALSTSTHSFLQPTPALHAAAVLAAKKFLDPLASSVIESQEARKLENRKKRKRLHQEDDSNRSTGEILQLREIYTDGFGISQIWEQAKRILEAAREEAERDLRTIQASQTDANQIEGNIQTKGDVKRVSFDEDGFEIGSEDVEDDLNNTVEAGMEDNEDEQEGEVKEAGDDEGILEEPEEDIEDIRDSEDVADIEQRPQTYVPDPNKLNDGFFSIDDFNKQSQFLEQQDAMGEDDNYSDEDEIDWDADPLATPLPSTTGRKKLEAEESTDSESGKGPTFGDVDLDASSEDEEDVNLDLEEGMPGLENTNDIQYADFFEPPAQKPSKTKRMRALPKTQPPPRPVGEPNSLEDIDNDIQRAISDVRRDLLDSDDEASSSENENAENQPNRPSTTNILSTHEKQRAKIAAEIRRLEAAAVSKRDWTLSGEARAADRPVNSLIEEDLEFERAGKPVPVITAEVSEEIEALIKRRIVAREFDEVVRRRPEAVGAASSARRGRVEVDDSKPTQGLADVYEAEHLKATDPGYVDKRSVALKKQHEEIDRLWKDVSAKLDVLSNLHFKPKRVEISVQVVGDKPSISMEDARPGAGDTGGTESRLAPQEIYRPGDEGKTRGEVMGKGGMARNKEELTKEERLRRRRREKERAKKQKGNEAVVSQQQQENQLASGKGRTPGKGQERKNILDELRKGGVKVIGKRGDLEEIGGRKGKGSREVEPRSTAYKL